MTVQAGPLASRGPHNDFVIFAHLNIKSGLKLNRFDTRKITKFLTDDVLTEVHFFEKRHLLFFNWEHTGVHLCLLCSV